RRRRGGSSNTEPYGSVYRCRPSRARGRGGGDEAMEITRAALHAAETTFGADHAETGSLRELSAGLCPALRDGCSLAIMGPRLAVVSRQLGSDGEENGRRPRALALRAQSWDFGSRHRVGYRKGTSMPEL